MRLGLRRVGWAEGGTEGGAGGIGAAVVAKRSRTHGAATSPSMRPFQHARLEIRVTASMFHQMVTAHEALVAEWAAKFLFPRMRAVVACQFIRTGKLLAAVWPGAGERTLTYNTGGKENQLSVFTHH